MVGHYPGTSVEDHAPAAPGVQSLLLGLADSICQGERERWTELGRGQEFFRGILEDLCCLVFEMFLWGKQRSVFLFKVGTGNVPTAQPSAEGPMADMKGKDGWAEEKLYELLVKNIKVEVAPVLS